VCKEITDVNNADLGKWECVHKDFWPLKPIEIIGTFVLALFKLTATVSGIGGGGLAIPMI